jgi:EmrB/QacA subfamily drug resistance transporter
MAAPQVDKRTLYSIMGSVLLGMLLAALDQTIVGPAMPQIIGDLQGFEYYSWVFTAYMLTSTITVPIVGKLSDLYGRKWFYAGGIVIFVVGSILSGFSTNIFELIVYRGVQGVGAGVIFACAFAIIADLIPPADRGRWQGAFGAVWGLASVIGPTVGGWLTDGPGWRWVFFVNVPVGILALAVIVTLYPRERVHARERSIDWFGALTLIACLTPLLLALSLGGTPGWEWGSQQIVWLFVASAIFLLAFIFVEARVAKEPIIPLDLFKHSIFTTSILTVFLTGVGLFGATLYIPLFIQAIQGDSATDSGNALTPMMISVVLASVLSGQIISRTGKYRVLGIVGMALVTIGMTLMWSMGMDTNRWVTVGYMVLLGFGMGITFPLYTLVVQNAFPMARVGVVTAALQFFRSIGGTVGVAVLGSVVNTMFHDRYPISFAVQYNSLKESLPAPIQANMPPADVFLSNLSNVNPQLLTSAEGLAQLKAQLIAAGVPGNFVDQLINVIVEAMRAPLYAGIQTAFLIGAVLFGVGIITTWFLKEIPLRKTNDYSGMVVEGGALPSGNAPEQASKELVPSGVPVSSTLPPRDQARL